jgi:hypothetical protein
MKINDDLEKLKSIFLSDDLDQEDVQENLEKINEWEKALIENENFQSWQEHEVTKKIIDQAKYTYREYFMRLGSVRDLTPEARASLHAKMDAILWLISLAEKDAKEEINQLHKQIKGAIAAV